MNSPAKDQERLREQYRNANNLNARIRLHQLYSANHYGWYRWLVDRILKIPQPARILELGCGPASLWIDQAGRVPASCQMYLTDLSSGMLQQARSGLPQAGHFYFSQADAQAIPFPTGYFDSIIANHMLYHVSDRGKALAEIRRVLRLGGVFFAATNGERNMHELDELIWQAAPDLIENDGNESFQKVITAFTLENGAQQIAAHFNHVQLEQYIDGLEVTEVSALVDYILSMTFTIQTITSERLVQFKNDLTQIIEQAIQSSGAVHITKNGGVFIAS